jgi:RimJ/RimL family protein N-acetyltransferase
MSGRDVFITIGHMTSNDCIAMTTHPASITRSHNVLRDGSAVLIRPVERTEAALLIDGFARLSVQSRWFRFLTAKPQLTAHEVRYFTDVDHHDHEALAALSCRGGHGVGIARYVRSVADPMAAEVAVTVVDDWQRRGVGTALLARLAERALDEGIRRFTALVSEDNEAVIRLLRRMSADVELVASEPGTLEYDIALRYLTPVGLTPIRAGGLR